MKKGIVIVIAFSLMLCATTFAAQTGTSWWHNHSYVDGDSYVDKSSEYERKRKNEALGLIADVTLYKTSILDMPTAVGIWSQYDFRNDDWGFYGKVSIDLDPLVRQGVEKARTMFGL